MFNRLGQFLKTSKLIMGLVNLHCFCLKMFFRGIYVFTWQCCYNCCLAPTLPSGTFPGILTACLAFHGQGYPLFTPFKHCLLNCLLLSDLVPFLGVFFFSSSCQSRGVFHAAVLQLLPLFSQSLDEAPVNKTERLKLLHSCYWLCCDGAVSSHLSPFPPCVHRQICRMDGDGMLTEVTTASYLGFLWTGKTALRMMSEIVECFYFYLLLLIS